MPFTFNGFGTKYAGHSNVVSDTATCDFCGREAQISSYDTRLWLCALFIPVIPLGRKRVLDDCSRCRKHRVMPLEQWHRLEQEVLERGEAARRGAPGDPEPALEHLGALSHFHRDEEALALAEDLARRFPDDPRVLLAAVDHLLGAGRDEEADRLLERACRLDPENPGARRLLAYRHVACERLDQARSMVDAPGAGDLGDPGLLLLLARGYQERGDHFTALERLRALVAAHPELGQQSEVRKAIRASEKAVGAPQSSLPRRELRFTRGMAIAAGIALLLASAVGFHLFRRAHRPVEVVSAVPGPISIAIDGGEPVELAGPGRTLLTVAEGAHRAEVKGALEESIEFTIETSWWQFGDPPLYVLNPGGLAAIGWEETVYGPMPANFRPGARIYAGRSFLRFAEVDYRFREFPEQIQVSSSSSRGEVRDRVFEIEGEPEEIAGGMLRLGEPADAIDYMAAWLARRPSPVLALGYAYVAARSDRAEEAMDLLRPLLGGDPIEVDYHRAYQELGDALPEYEETLRREYDELLAERPDDPAAHYLRGRIEPDPERAEAFYARSRALDPLYEYPARASAYAALSSGELDRAADVLRPVATHDDSGDEAFDLYLVALEAAGRDAELEERLEPVRSNPAEQLWIRCDALVRLLVRTGRTEEAEEWTVALEQQPETRALGLRLRGVLLYATGGFAELGRRARLVGYFAGQAESLAFWAALELGDPGAIGETFSRLPEAEREGMAELLLALEHARRGEEGMSRRWQKAGLEHLSTDGPEFRAFAALLDGDEPVTERTLDALVLPLPEKTVALTLLAVRRPETADLALRYADRLNYSLAFPHHFLRRFQPRPEAEAPAG